MGNELLARWFAPGAPYVRARWLWLRALGLIFFSAFYSLLFQIHGLIGPNGILPAREFLPALRQFTGWKAFWLVTVPLSASGIFAGALLCFIPIAGEFVIPDLLGGSDALMIGQTLWTEFFQNKDWPVASAVAIALLVILLMPILVYQHLQMRALGDR